MRARKAALGLTDAALDAVTGLQSGYVGKLLGPKRTKSLGPLSLGLVLQGLACRLVLVEDADAAARMADRWEKRVRPAPMRAFARMRRATWLMDPRAARQNARKRWSNTPSADRSKAAKKAAKARWKKVRERRLAARRLREGDSAGADG